jgi:very-short-patch-repair endonuclease
MEEPSRKLARARAMRHAPVVTERLLWDLLRDRRLGGLKFRRQVPLGRYIVDFLCLRHRLIIEADGPSHEDSLQDLYRDAWLKSQSFRIIRFPNKEIQDCPDAVLAKILEACNR